MGRVSKTAIRSYFEYNAVKNQATCKTCLCKLKGNHGTNLKKHLSIHTDIYEEYILKDKATITQASDGKMKCKETENILHFFQPNIKINIDSKTIIDACIELVTVNGRPYSLMDDTGFKKILNPILNGVNSLKKKPTLTINSNTIKKYVKEESTKIKNNIMKEIHNKLISLKVDAVTRCNRSFLGINLQYIIDDTIILRTLGLIELTESHTGLYLKDTILNVLKNFNIDPCQLYTITSDNGANMVKAINLIERNILPEVFTSGSENECESEGMEISEPEIDSIIESDKDSDNSEFEWDQTILDQDQISEILNENIENIDKEYEQSENIIKNVELQSISNYPIFSGIRCVAHTLQLAVLDCLKDDDITRILNKVRSLVKKLRNQTYTYVIKKEKLKLPILDCLTRWHSTLDMLERILYLREFIKNMSANDSKLKKCSLSNFEWGQVEIISKTLLPAKMCTKKLQYEQLTLSDFYGAWMLCKLETEALNSSMSKKLLQFIVDREKHIMNNPILIGAIFLDPRYKITLDEEQCNKAINHLIKVWIHLKTVERRDNQNITHNDNNDEDQPETSTSDSNDVLEHFLKNKDNKNDSLSIDFNITNSQTSTMATRIETILKSYHINQNRLNHKVNVLQFWKTMEASFPELSELAKVVLGVPATQVSVERLFSGLKFILSPYRSNISSKNVEDILLVRTNVLFNKNK